jgi:hypothetical protein
MTHTKGANLCSLFAFSLGLVFCCGHVNCHSPNFVQCIERARTNLRTKSSNHVRRKWKPAVPLLLLPPVSENIQQQE